MLNVQKDNWFYWLYFDSNFRLNCVHVALLPYKSWIILFCKWWLWFVHDCIGIWTQDAWFATGSYQDIACSCVLYDLRGYLLYTVMHIIASSCLIKLSWQSYCWYLCNGLMGQAGLEPKTYRGMTFCMILMVVLAISV